MKEVHEREDNEDDLNDEKSKRQDKEDEGSLKSSKPQGSNHGGSMYLHERLYWGARDIGQQVRGRLSHLF